MRSIAATRCVAAPRRDDAGMTSWVSSVGRGTLDLAVGCVKCSAAQRGRTEFVALGRARVGLGPTYTRPQTNKFNKREQSSFQPPEYAKRHRDCSRCRSNRPIKRQRPREGPLGLLLLSSLRGKDGRLLILLTIRFGLQRDADIPNSSCNLLFLDA